MSDIGDPEITPPLALNEISGDDIKSRSEIEMRLFLNEISGDDIKSRSEIEIRRSEMTQKSHFGVSKTYAVPCKKQQSAPSKITIAILLIKPGGF